MRMLLPALVLLLFILATGCDLLEGSKIENAVLKALADDPRTSQFTFEVAFEAGTVTIIGEVFMPEDGDAVMEIAKSVEGVEQVRNRVHTPEESSGMMQDHVVPSPFF